MVPTISVSTLSAMGQKKSICAFSSQQYSSLGEALISILAGERASMIHYHWYLYRRTWQLHHRIHHNCLNLVSHGVQRDRISNLSNLERVVWRIPHTDHGWRASMHDSFALVSIQKYIEHHCIHHNCLMVVSYCVEIAIVSNLCNLERVVWLNPHSDHNQRACKNDSFAFVHRRTLKIMESIIMASTLQPCQLWPRKNQYVLYYQASIVSQVKPSYQSWLESVLA